MDKELIYDSETGKLVSGNDDELFQNRDIIKWMDRIKMGEAFMDDAQKVMKIIHEVLNGVATKYFSGAWKTKVEPHADPFNLKIESNIMAPTIHKEHEDGDEDKYFIYFKEYPFRYTFNITDTFGMDAVDEKMKANEDYYKEFYLSDVSEEVESNIGSIIEARIKREVGTDVFHFPKKGEEHPIGKINVVLSTAWKLNSSGKKGGQSALPGVAVDAHAKLANGGSVNTYLTSDDLRNAIAREISIAMGRLTPIEKLSVKEG